MNYNNIFKYYNENDLTSILNDCKNEQGLKNDVQLIEIIPNEKQSQMLLNYLHSDYRASFKSYLSNMKELSSSHALNYPIALWIESDSLFFEW